MNPHDWQRREARMKRVLMPDERETRRFRIGVIGVLVVVVALSLALLAVLLWR